MLIETIAILGQKPRTRAFAVSLARADKYLVDIHARTTDELQFYARAARTANLRPLSFIFSQSVGKAAWGADAVIIDSSAHIALLPEIALAANDTAILLYAGTLSTEHAKAIKTALKSTSLTYASPALLPRLWPDCPPLPV